MAKGVRKVVVALMLAALLAAGVSACGNGGDDSTATDGPAATSPSTTEGGPGEGGSSAQGSGSEKPGEANGDGGSSEGEGSTGEGGTNTGGDGSSEADGSGVSSSKVAAPLRVSGGGSGSFREPGGDNSIQEYGSEGSSSELEEAATVLHSFLVARAEEDWAGACSYFARPMVQQLEQLAEQSSQLKGKGCPPILDALTAKVSDATRRALTEVDAISLRRDDQGGFLLFHGAEGTDYFMPMTQEDGVWKVGALASTAFP